AEADGLAFETHTGWTARSPSTGIFRDREEGRRALIEWARAHRSLSFALSSARCLVLADAGDGTFRLWQVVRREPTLRDQLSLAFGESPERVADALVGAARMVLAAPRLAHAGKPGRSVSAVRIEDIGIVDGQPVVIGPAPHPLEGRVLPAPPRRHDERLEEAFGSLVREGLRCRVPETPAVIDRILERCSSLPDLGETGAALAMVLLGEAPAP
ncbi:MAG: hypothetical protein JNK60_23310, partial [Acidobacteria bacterium]|nr:hypothetical protein [Acidobacteriota bacterium]